MQNNTQESWEERFEKIWREFEIENAYEYDNSFVKSFIHALLSKQAEEISEAVEGLRKSQGLVINLVSRGKLDEAKEANVYNSAIKDVLGLLAIKQVINK